MKNRSIIPVLILNALLSACASQVPREIREPDFGPGVAEARSDIERHEGRVVRWGGTIANVENAPDATMIEVVSRPLERGGQPESGDETDGRFLARIEGFLDPAIYVKGREVTVTGPLEAALEREIGDFEYLFPVVRADRFYLWPERARPDFYGSPYHGGYYPWWHPWYGYGRYGYPYW